MDMNIIILNKNKFANIKNKKKKSCLLKYKKSIFYLKTYKIIYK